MVLAHHTKQNLNRLSDIFRLFRPRRDTITADYPYLSTQDEEQRNPSSTMKFAALVSGGKDSLYAIQLAMADPCRHELVCCVHLAKPPVGNAQEEESFLYQSAASEAVVTQIEQCLEVSLITVVRTGTSRNTSCALII